MRVLVLSLVIIALVLGGASVWLQGPLPLDVAISRALQTVIPARSAWIAWLSGTAGWPWIIPSALVAAVFAASLAGLRGAAAALAGMGLAMATERALRLVIAVPRPSAEQVDIAQLSTSSGLPSTFAIFYGAACGSLMLLSRTARGAEAVAVRWGAALVLIAGCVGRVAAGGHWTSQVVASAALGLLASVVMLRMFGQLTFRR
jgi:membrane-associated phospholipid phosphatase